MRQHRSLAPDLVDVQKWEPWYLHTFLAMAERAAIVGSILRRKHRSQHHDRSHGCDIIGTY